MERYIGIIGAMESETKRLISLLENMEVKNICNVDFYVGKLKGKNVVICNSNEGKVNSAMVTQIMICSFRLDVLLNVGVAGGIYEDMSVYDIAIATSCVEHDYNIKELGYDRGMVLGINKIQIPVDNRVSDLLYDISRRNNNAFKGCIASGDLFIADKNMAKKIRNKFDAIAIDMESAAIAHVCYSNNVKCGILRSISDSRKWC